MYHYVHDEDPLPRRTDGMGAGGIPRLTCAALAAQIDELCRVMEPIDWPSFFAWTDGRASVPRRCFLLTFDDGLADHSRNVVPILQHRGLRGTFFIPGAVLTSHCLLPAHALHLLFALLDDATLEQELSSYLAQHHRSRDDWRSPGGLTEAAAMYGYESPSRARLKYWLNMKLPATIRNQAVRTVFERRIGSMTRWARHWYLSWEDVAAMEAQGHTLGAHGFNHEPYTRMSAVERRHDLHRAASVLHNGLGPDVRPFSFPYGRYDHDACAACRDAGFAHGFTTEERWAMVSDDPYRMPRVDTIHVQAAMNTEVPCGPTSQ
jgi:peptidoglycan/xylan/chitin deacetylase (PgdA/CDA1 family)